MNLHLYQYNNYYNRTIKPIGSLDDIAEYEVFVEANANFNPNDGITTTHIIGGPLTYGGDADYFIAEEYGEIISRWFIIENQRTRGGQYKITLKRDSINDFAGQVLAAPCFVEKGWVNDSDPAIYNQERANYNQIKKNEKLLKDTTGMPWLVAYYTKDPAAINVSVPAVSANADYEVNKLSDWTYYNYTVSPIKKMKSVDLNLYFMPSDLTTAHEANVMYSGLGDNLQLLASGVVDGNSSGRHYTIDTDSFLWGGLGGRWSSIDSKVLSKLTELLQANSTKLLQAAGQFFPNYASDSDIAAVEATIGRTIYDRETKKFYRIEATYTNGIKDSINATPGLTSEFGFEMYRIYQQCQTDTGGITGKYPTADSTSKDFALAFPVYDGILLEPKEISLSGVSGTINPDANFRTGDEPFNVFCIPYGTLDTLNNGERAITSADLAKRFMAQLVQNNLHNGTSGRVLDVQLLPYCPIQEIRDNITGQTNKKLIVHNLPAGMYSPLTDTNDEIVGYIFHCKSVNFSFTIDYTLKIPNIKISNETEFCRIVSPNWNGMFEFSPAKNKGINGFTVDVSLKPYTPYIHVSPIWNQNGLYGKRENDPIGLICGGDFSLSLASDAWATYERQNKNYQQIFDREIQSLEVNNKVGRLQDVVGATVGTLQGAGTGAMMGSMSGSPYGAAIGAVAGGVASGIGGTADIAINDTLRMEAMDLKKDIYKYQLQNIKALPLSLAKVNSFNPNNTIFPILEFYGATDTEVEALKNEIKYNGMTIGRIGKIMEFRNPEADWTYIKGQMILLEGLGEDSHMANDIATEINKGVRI